MYASGMVDGQREWMGLYPYLHPRPRNEEELDERVPIGTSIPIYLFPELKGRSRVRVYADTPPAEAYHREAITAANYGLTGLAICRGAAVHSESGAAALLHSEGGVNTSNRINAVRSR
jgi:hypothetical protein